MAIERQQSLSLPWKAKLQLSVVDFITDMTLRRDGTINRRLIDFLDRKVPAKSTPQNGVRSHDVTVDAHGDVWFRVFVPTHVPSDVVSLPVIFFFHGGGFSLLSAASPGYDAVCRRFARKINAVVVSLNYRLAPEHEFPAQYNDGFDALKFIDENRRSLEFWPENADVGRCFLAGDSAGANLAHHLGVRASQAEFKEVKIIGLIVIQPFFYGNDRTESEIRLEGAPIVSRRRVEWMWKAFLPRGEDLDHWAVNVSGPNAVDISSLDVPPVILFIGGFDPLRDWQLRYHDWLKNSGKNVTLFDIPTVCHAFYIFPEIPESLMLIRETTDFIEKQSSKIRVR